MSPRRPEQFEEMREQSRHRILTTALELFATRGFHTTSIEAICKKAKISKGLVYNYFKSKDALLEAIIVGSIQHLVMSFSDLFEEREPRTQLRNLIIRMSDIAESDIEFWRFYWSLVSQPALPKRIHKKMMDALRQVISMFTVLFTKLEYRDPEAEAWTLAAALDGVALYNAFDSEHCPLKRIRNAMLERYGITAPPEKTSKRNTSSIKGML